MQKHALFFLLAITISLVAPFESALAQETPADEMSEDEMMADETMEDEMMADETMGAEAMEETEVESPLKQMATGIEPHEIQCKSGQKLVFKASNFRPSCINESSFQILLDRGWVSSHEPSHEDLQKMMDEYMATQPKEIEEETEEIEEGGVEIAEDVSVEEETDTGNGNETEAEPQNHLVDLREDMEMGTE